MSYLDPKWRYNDAETSRKPGYLKRRFDEIRRKQKEAKEAENAAELERIQKVRRIAK